MASKSKEQVCIFIDDSNLFIEGMKFMATQLDLVVKQDRRFRIEFSELIRILARNRHILCKRIYGSGSLSNYDLLVAVKDEGIKARVFDKSYKGKEKEVDSTLAADVVDKAACLRFQPPEHLKPHSVTFIIVSGDRDYLQALRKVHKHGWKLEVVGWKSSISDRVKDYVNENEDKGAKLVTLDHLMEKNPSFYFIESRWSTETEGSHSCYEFEYNTPQKEEDARLLSFQVVNLIKRPCQYLRPGSDPRIVKIVVLVEYKNQQEINTDQLNLIVEFQHVFCHRVSFVISKDTDSDELLNDGEDDDDEDGVEERCAYKFSCQQGKNCRCRHTRAEKEHFEINSRHLGRKYKSRMCRNVPGGRCTFMKNPRKCPWAHGLTDARCYMCDRGGLVGDHWMDNCPRKLPKHQQKQKLGDFMDAKILLQNLTLSDKVRYHIIAESESESSGLTEDELDCDDSEFGSEL